MEATQMADIDLGDLLDDVELKVPTTQVERVEDARTLESAIRYFDGKMEEFENRKDKKSGHPWVKEETSRKGGETVPTGRWIVRMSLHQMPIYVQQKTLDDKVQIMACSEDGSELSLHAERNKIVGISQLVVKDFAAGVAWLKKFRASPVFETIMESASKGLIEMNDIESPNVYRRTKYLYEGYCKDNADTCSGWGSMEDKDEGTKRSDKKASVISSLNQKAKRDLGYQRWRMSSAS